MFSAIIPELMSITVFVLSILSLLAGKSPGYLQSRYVVSMNITGLKASHYANTSTVLPVPDFYNVHLTTHCQGYYHDGISPPLVNVTCSPTSSNAKFLPSNLVAQSLAQSHSNATLSSIAFPQQIQSRFVSAYNLQLHVSFVFYILSLICTGTAVLYGILALLFGPLGVFTALFTSMGSTCLLISSAIVTAVQIQAAGTINEFGDGLGIQGSTGTGLLRLTWTAFGLSFASTAVWTIAGTLSAAVRD